VLGVGHNEEPVSEVRRADGTSRYIERPRGVAQTFKVIEDVVEYGCADSRNILSKHPSGPEFVDNSEILWPEIALILLAFPLARETVGLARESSANKVNWLEVVSSDISDISISGHGWPMLFQYPIAVGVILNLPQHAHPSTFEAQIKATNA